MDQEQSQLQSSSSVLDSNQTCDSPTDMPRDDKFIIQKSYPTSVTAPSRYDCLATEPLPYTHHENYQDVFRLSQKKMDGSPKVAETPTDPQTDVEASVDSSAFNTFGVLRQTKNTVKASSPSTFQSTESESSNSPISYSPWKQQNFKVLPPPHPLFTETPGLLSPTLSISLLEEIESLSSRPSLKPAPFRLVTIPKLPISTDVSIAHAKKPDGAEATNATEMSTSLSASKPDDDVSPETVGNHCTRHCKELVFVNYSQEKCEFLKIGPSFGRTNQVLNIVDSEGKSIYAILACRLDRGFHMVDGEWITYRRNYFTLTASYSLTFGDPVEYGKVPRCNLYLDVDKEKSKILFFSIKTSAIELDSSKGFQNVALIQHTSKCNIGTQQEPSVIPIVPGILPSHEFIKNNCILRATNQKQGIEKLLAYPKVELGEFGQYYITNSETNDSIPFVALFERLQFSTPSGGDSCKVKALVQLIVTLESGDSYVAAWSETPYFTLRIRPPSSYPERIALIQRPIGIRPVSAPLARDKRGMVSAQPKDVSRLREDDQEKEVLPHSLPSNATNIPSSTKISLAELSSVPKNSRVIVTDSQILAPNSEKPPKMQEPSNEVPENSSSKNTNTESELGQPNQDFQNGTVHMVDHVFHKPNGKSLPNNYTVSDDSRKQNHNPTISPYPVSVHQQSSILSKMGLLVSKAQSARNHNVNSHFSNTNPILRFIRPRLVSSQPLQRNQASHTNGHVSKTDLIGQNSKAIANETAYNYSSPPAIDPLQPKLSSFPKTGTDIDSNIPINDNLNPKPIEKKTSLNIHPNNGIELNTCKENFDTFSKNIQKRKRRESASKRRQRRSKKNKITQQETGDDKILNKAHASSLGNRRDDGRVNKQATLVSAASSFSNPNNPKQDPEILELAEANYDEPHKPVALSNDGGSSLKILPTGSLYSAPSMPTPRNTEKVFKVVRKQVGGNQTNQQKVLKIAKPRVQQDTNITIPNGCSKTGIKSDSQEMEFLPKPALHTSSVHRPLMSDLGVKPDDSYIIVDDTLAFE